MTDELARQTALLAQKKEALVAVGKKYDADKRRWQEIKARAGAAAERQRAADQQKAGQRRRRCGSASQSRAKSASAASPGTTR